MELEVADKKASHKVQTFTIALIANFCKGFALGLALGVSTWLETLIIESESMLVLTIKDILIPIGTIVLFYHLANKILIRLGLVARLTHIMGRLTALVIGIVGFIAGMFLYVLLKFEAETFSQGAVGTSNEINLEILSFLVFVAGILIIYKILKL